MRLVDLWKVCGQWTWSRLKVIFFCFKTILFKLDGIFNHKRPSETICPLFEGNIMSETQELTFAKRLKEQTTTTHDSVDNLVMSVQPFSSKENYIKSWNFNLFSTRLLTISIKMPNWTKPFQSLNTWRVTMLWLKTWKTWVKSLTNLTKNATRNRQ